MVGTSSSASSDAGPSEIQCEANPSRSQRQPPAFADGASYVEAKEKEEEGQPPPLRSMSSFRARLRGARRDAGAPASLFQWETRGHFWSALDKAAAPKDPSQARTGLSGLLVRAWLRTKVRVKNTATVVRLRPSVLVWPLLLCAVCIGLGIMGVELGAKHYNDRSKSDALTAAAEAVNSLDLVWTQGLQPLASLELQVLLQPQMSQLGPSFQGISAQLLQKAPPVLPALLLAPFGIARAAYTPAAAGSAAATAAQALLNTLVPPLDSTVSSSAFQSLILQPYSGASASQLPPQTLLASRPVLISGVAADQDWGNGPGPDGKPIANCTAPSCFYVPGSQPANGTRLWGFAVGLLDLGALAWQPNAGLRTLLDLGYSYRLTLLSNATGQGQGQGQPLAKVDSSPPVPGGGSAPVTSTLAVPGASAVLQLEVYPEGGWVPYWRSPLLTVVVILSVAVSVMLFSALVLQHRHVMFLEAMLPKQCIGVLTTGRSFYQHYDLVTVLYADIVRYSNAPTGMPAWEVVKLLNDVNNMYDSLLEKHGLVKIRRSGEAFMAVGGCPEAGDPVAVATRVAMCAREMVLATAGFRSSAGQRVQIRLGLHSGPAVAAVLGKQTPRFSLLGDTVDIAHFMESTSTIMGVHVSDITAELLNIADDPLISLQPRGIIDIKGRGPITTFWLRIDLLAPSGTWNGEHGANGGGGNSSFGKGGAAGSGARGSQSGAKPAAAPADIECTADLAVAATLGVRGAPLVRKLSQTGLTQTRRTLPDRRQRADRHYNDSLLGSFTLRLEAETILMVKDMLGRPTPPPSPSRASRQRGRSVAGAAPEGPAAAALTGAADAGGALGKGSSGGGAGAEGLRQGEINLVPLLPGATSDELAAGCTTDAGQKPGGSGGAAAAAAAAAATAAATAATVAAGGASAVGPPTPGPLASWGSDVGGGAESRVGTVEAGAADTGAAQGSLSAVAEEGEEAAGTGAGGSAPKAGGAASACLEIEVG